MTYDSNIQATEMTAFPEFYQMSFGTTIERYTSYSEDVVFGFYTWKAAPIKRTSFSRDSDFSALTTTITCFPTDMLKLYVASVPVEPVRIIIYRALTANLSSYATLFSGLLKDVQFSGGQVQALCIAEAQYLKKKMPPMLDQSFCNHTLYDTRCGLDKLAWKISGLMTNVNGTSITLVEASTKANGYFNMGMIEVAGDMRMIIKHIGSVLTIHTPFDSRAAVGVNANIYPGCDKNPLTCQSKFNNHTNGFLGFPYIPTRNPVIMGFK